jgi:hypothetical protein
MTTTLSINVQEIINDDAALTPKAGDKVYEHVADSLEKKNKTIVSFKGIKYMTTAFLNAAIGQLYSKFDSNYLNQFLEVKISDADLPLLERVLINARIYFSDKNTIDEALNDFVNE